MACFMRAFADVSAPGDAALCPRDVLYGHNTWVFPNTHGENPGDSYKDDLAATADSGTKR
jgi:hypothetical protein